MKRTGLLIVSAVATFAAACSSPTSAQSEETICKNFFKEFQAVVKENLPSNTLTSDQRKALIEKQISLTADAYEKLGIEGYKGKIGKNVFEDFDPSYYVDGSENDPNLKTQLISKCSNHLDSSDTNVLDFFVK